MKTWVVLASAVFASTAFGQSPPPETLPVMPPPTMPCEECAPACSPCWSFSIPKRPIRTWLSCCESVQKCREFFSYKSTSCGSCCPTPDPSIHPPLYTYFWPLHCADGNCGGCGSLNGMWNNNVHMAEGGFASAGLPVSTTQYTHNGQAPKNESWFRSMTARFRNEKAPAPHAVIVPVSGQAPR